MSLDLTFALEVLTVYTFIPYVGVASVAKGFSTHLDALVYGQMQEAFRSYLPISHTAGHLAPYFDPFAFCVTMVITCKFHIFYYHFVIYGFGVNIALLLCYIKAFWRLESKNHPYLTTSLLESSLWS